MNKRLHPRADKASNETRLTILVVDDEPVNRSILSRMLKKVGHAVIVAENGLEAVKAFKRHSPDMVLMDVMMPKMDGYEAAMHIKTISGDHFTPVIFLTALSDEAALAKCIACGGDDFLGKPYSGTLLKAKIDAMSRIQRLNKVVMLQRDELLGHRARAERELEVGQQVLSKLIRHDALAKGNLEYTLTPLETFSGDLLLAATRPNGVQHILLGDFTGHGLSAALGAIPVAETFYTMTSKGFCTADIARTINAKLHRLLPTGMYCAAALIELNLANSSCWIWNGGLPDVVFTNVDGRFFHSTSSMHLPLGVGDDDCFDDHVEMVQISEGDHIYVLSDGVVEARNSEGELFGEERAFQAITNTAVNKNTNEDHGILNLSASLDKFIDPTNRTDDITYAEIICSEKLLDDQQPHQNHATARKPMNWHTQFNLSGPVLRYFDPVPALMTQLTELQGLGQHRQSLHVIITELFSNALDHGLLDLSSSLKEGPNGFERFYEEREQRLHALSDGFIKISLEHLADGDGGKVIVEFVDSGKGFDITSATNRSATALDGHISQGGRGLALMRNLCKTLDYSDGGRRARAVFCWTQQETNEMKRAA